MAKAVLHGEDPGLYASWIAALDRAERAGGRLTLRAPSRFHGAYVQAHLERKILLACREVDSEVTELRITV